MGEKSDDRGNSEMGREQAIPKKEQEGECGEIFRSCAEEKDKSQQIDEVHGQKQECRTGG